MVLNAGLNTPQLGILASINKGNSCTLLTCSTCTANAMNIFLCIARQIIVKDMSYPFNIQPSGCNICSNQNLQLGLPELLQDIGSLQLGQIPMKLISQIASTGQGHSHLRNPALGTAKYHSQIWILLVNQLAQLVQLGILYRIHNPLLNIVQGNVLSLDNYMLEVCHIAMSQSLYLVRHGSRKQHNLSISGHSTQNLLHILQKASTQHFICFVQHNAIGISKANGLATHMIQNTPRGTNNHMRLSPQFLLLPFNILTAINS